MDARLDVRPSPIAGQWYSADARELAHSIDQYMDKARLPEIEGQVLAVMAPHAGHYYSGPVAGYAFAALRGLKPDLVVVASPSHYPYAQPLLTSAHGAYETPLGKIAVDHETLKALDAVLLQELGFGLAAVRRDPEHSLEIELPFLQRALGGPFQLLPLMVREQTTGVARRLGQALAETLHGKHIILVGSTDLSHFYVQQDAKRLDAEVLRRVEAFDADGVVQVEDEQKGFACGRGALAAVMWAAKGLGADAVKVLHYATSGDVSGDYDRVVGYGAAVITRRTNQ